MNDLPTTGPQPMPSRRRVLQLGAGLALVSGLAACTGNANSNLPGSGGSGGSDVLTIAGGAADPALIQNFNPFDLSNRLGGTLLVYEPLEVRSAIDGSYEPFLATKHAFSDPKTLQVTLRQGVKWNDGQAFSADDVVFTFDLLKKFPALDTNGVWAQVAGVQRSDDGVTVTFKEANVPFAGIVLATTIVPRHAWSGVADPVKYANTKPVGTGPFQLDTFAPTRYQLKKYSGYWQADVVAPSAVVFPATSSNQSTNQLEVVSGTYDWAYQFIPNVKQTYVARDPEHNTYWFPPGGIIALFMNLTKAPYTDVNYRTGLSLALDRDLIAKKAVNGYLTGASQSGLVLPNLKRWLDPSLDNQGYVKQDTGAALAAFAKAGFRQQGGRLVGRNGQQASLSITIPAGFSDWVAGGTEVVNQLKAIGIDAKLVLPQYPQYSSATQAGTFDTAFGGFGGTGDPYTDYNNALNSSFATPVNTPTLNNFERFKSATVDRALATLAAATEMSAQLQATYALEQVMVSQVPIVQLYYGGLWGLYRTANFTGWPSADDPYTTPTPYNSSLLVVATHLKKA